MDKHFNNISRNNHDSNLRIYFRLGAGWVSVAIVGDGER